jgi:hypothetical protein
VWLFTTVGFFSVVAGKNASDVTVRARFSGDLERLRKAYLPTLGPTKVAGTDYPFRAFVSKDQFAVAIQAMTLDIDYSNFKNRIADEFGTDRHDVYTNVWAILRSKGSKRNA